MGYLRTSLLASHSWCLKFKIFLLIYRLNQKDFYILETNDKKKFFIKKDLVIAVSNQIIIIIL